MITSTTMHTGDGGGVGADDAAGTGGSDSGGVDNVGTTVVSGGRVLLGERKSNWCEHLLIFYVTVV